MVTFDPGRRKQFERNVIAMSATWYHHATRHEAIRYKRTVIVLSYESVDAFSYEKPKKTATHDIVLHLTHEQLITTASTLTSDVLLRVPGKNWVIKCGPFATPLARYARK